MRQGSFLFCTTETCFTQTCCTFCVGLFKPPLVYLLWADYRQLFVACRSLECELMAWKLNYNVKIRHFILLDQKRYMLLFRPIVLLTMAMEWSWKRATCFFTLSGMQLLTCLTSKRSVLWPLLRPVSNCTTKLSGYTHNTHAHYTGVLVFNPVIKHTNVYHNTIFIHYRVKIH